MLVHCYTAHGLQCRWEQAVGGDADTGQHVHGTPHISTAAFVIGMSAQWPRRCLKVGG